jgi:hypothetical protein
LVDDGARIINGATNPMTNLCDLIKVFPSGWRGSPAEAEALYAEYLEENRTSPVEWCYANPQAMATLTYTIEAWLKSCEKTEK